MAEREDEPTEFIEYTPPLQTEDEGPKPLRTRLRVELRDLLDHVIRTSILCYPRRCDAGLPVLAELISNGRQNGMRYTPEGYARVVVAQCGYKLVGWPSAVPFRNLSDIGGGAGSLLELLRLWNLPEEDAERLRFERASAEEIARAVCDPESVHPNRAKLEEERRAAAAETETETETAAGGSPTVVLADVFHPDGLDLVGVHPTSTDPAAAGLGSHEQAQRVDMGRRRQRAVDISGETRLRKLPAKRGITTPRFVLEEESAGQESRPSAEDWGGEQGAGGDGERAHKRVRVEDRRALAVNDPVDQFLLSARFGGAAGDVEGARRRFRGQSQARSSRTRRPL